MTEQELVQAAQGGDQTAFRQLVEANQTRIYQLCFRMTGSREDAADLTQEVFLSAWRSLAGFQGQAAFSTWLYRLAANASIDFLRMEKRRGALSLTAEEEEGADARQLEVTDQRWSPQRVLEQKEAREAVRRGLAALSPEHRQVLVLRDLEGLSYQEIARHLDLEEGTVKSRIARARLALRDFFIKEGTFLPPHRPSK